MTKREKILFFLWNPYIGTMQARQFRPNANYNTNKALASKMLYLILSIGGWEEKQTSKSNTRDIIRHFYCADIFVIDNEKERPRGCK